MGLLTLAVLVALGSSGCYYTHLADGQLRLLWGRRPIAEARRDPELPSEERELLGLAETTRRFARGLGLRVGEQYTQYVDWPGDRVVTTLVRTRPGSLEADPFWFPFLGRLPYKGYFDRARAEAAAERLRQESYDVCVTGVAAYSTLGWFDDPVTGPMLRGGPMSLVETILHELVHATAFFADDPDFSESAALFVGQEAAVRFFSTPRGEIGGRPAPSADRVRAWVEDRRRVARTLLDFRAQLAGLPEADEDRPALRAAAEDRARKQLASLPLRVLDPEKVAARARLSDACLALRGTYAEALPDHARVLEALNGDLARMVQRLVRWSEERRPVADYFRVDAPTRTPSAANEAGDSSEAGDREDTSAQSGPRSMVPCWTRPRNTARHASVSISASCAPSSSRPV